MLFPGTQKADDAGHAEQGQIAANGRPLGAVRAEQIGACRYIRDHKEALDNPDDPGTVGVCHHVHAVQPLCHPVILQNGQTGGQQQHCRQQHANDRLQGDAEELSPGDVKILTGAAKQKVDQHEYDLSGKEEVIEHCHQCHRKSKYPPAVVVHPFLQGNQQQREKSGHILEVVEEDVVCLEAGKGVEHGTDGGSTGTAHKAADISIPGHSRHAVLEAEQPGYQIGDCAAGEGYGQPEEGTAQQVEGVGADKVRP